jgi:hypothetical protein
LQVTKISMPRPFRPHTFQLREERLEDTEQQADMASAHLTLDKDTQAPLNLE